MFFQKYGLMISTLNGEDRERSEESAVLISLKQNINTLGGCLVVLGHTSEARGVSL